MCIRAGLLAELKHLQHFALYLTHNRTAAEDLVSRTCVRALEAEDQFQPGTNLRAWLCTIELNIFRSDFRKPGQFTQTDEQTLDRPCPPAQENELYLQEVLANISKMSAADQLVLRMIGMEGAQYEEVATALGVPSGTVKSRVARARTKLSESIYRPHSYRPRRPYRGARRTQSWQA